MQPKPDSYHNLWNKVGSRLKIWRIPFLPVNWYVKNSGTTFSSDKFQLRNTYWVQTPAKSKDMRRYIICADLGDMYGGLGCCLSVLAPCWNYARQTNRTLVIDWRRNPYTRHDPNINLFPLLFDEPNEKEIGVPCIANDSLTEIKFPQPILGPAESLKQSWGVHRLPSGGLSASCFQHIMRFCKDVELLLCFLVYQPYLE